MTSTRPKSTWELRAEAAEAELARLRAEIRKLSVVLRKFPEDGRFVRWFEMNSLANELARLLLDNLRGRCAFRDPGGLSCEQVRAVDEFCTSCLAAVVLEANDVTKKRGYSDGQL